MYKEHIISTKDELLTSGFSGSPGNPTPNRKSHNGADYISAKKGVNDLMHTARGVDIIALADGKVVEIIKPGDKWYSENGNTVGISHAGMIFSRCKHMRDGSVPVKVGDTVKKGQIIGVMGNTGNCSSVRTDLPPQYKGTHGHFEIKENSTSSTTGDFVNPEPYLKGEKSIPGASGNTTNDTVTLAVKHAADIIYANEGNYGSVNKNDNGALSIGKVQWHSSRALALMKTIVKANLIQAQNMLGLALYNEILNAAANTWDKRVVNDAEAKALSALLTTAEGKSVQDALAVADITSYVNKGMSYGLKDCGALIYFADGVNQYGTNAALWKQISEAALKTTGDVTAMWNATKTRTQNYLARREKAYKAVIALNLSGTSSASPLKSIDEIAKEVIRGSWGNGQDRVNRLTTAGYDAKAVQTKVNLLLK